MISEKPSKPYSSAKRDAKAAETRKRLVDAALVLLGEADAPAVSLDAVARSAGVTRLTVYHQFGSRNGLLEAAFDSIAARGGMGRLASAMAIADPRAALADVVATFCDFWSSHEGLAGIYAAAALDAELGAALAARNERRRELLRVLVNRAKRVHGQQKADVVDQLFMLTSFATFTSLRASGRDRDAVFALLQPLCDHVFAGGTA